MDRLIKKLCRINDAVAVAAGFLLLACVIITIVDLIARRLGASLGGTDEISGYVMAITTSWGVSYALTALAHVRIDLLRAKVSVAKAAIFDTIAMLSLAATAVFVAHKSWSVLSKTLSTGARANTPLETPMWIPQTLWWAGWLWFAISAVILSFAILYYLAKGNVKEIDNIAGVRSEI